MSFAFITIVILLMILSFVWPPDSPWSPWWRTNKKIAQAACRLARVSRKDIVYELGSGDGEFILVATGEFHAKKGVGIEIDYSRYFISKIRKYVSKNRGVEFVRCDFKKIGLANATVVYLYLVPAVIEKIIPKLEKELKKGTRIVSFVYPVPLKLAKQDKKNRLFLYKI